MKILIGEEIIIPINPSHHLKNTGVLWLNLIPKKIHLIAI